MRGDGVGVGDVDAVFGVVWNEEDEPCGNDGEQSRREPDACDVVCFFGLELITLVECCRDRLGLCDGAWGRAGVCGADGDDEGRTVG